MSHLDRRALLVAGAGTVASAPLLTFAPAEAGTRTTKVFRGRFSASTRDDWYYLPFKVPKGVRRIEVSYTYPDPIDSGLGFSKNVIDIGIFDSSGIGVGNAKGFRGWSGGARTSFRLSRTSATPGYLPGPITPGRWRIALGPYQVVTPIDYEVRVTLVHGAAGADFEPAPAPTAVPGTGAGWYRGDLHVHTVHSDGSQTQRQVLEYAVAAGLDFIGTSEHNTSSATGTWGRYVPEGFLVIPGEEVTTRLGHWLATGIPNGTWIDWRYRDAQRLAEFTQQVRDLGGISIAAHPNVPVPSIRWDLDTEFTHMDAIEVWNGPWDAFDSAAVTRWHDLLTRGVFKPAVGNSDTHRESQRIGLPQTVVRAEELSVEALVRAYREGRCWIAESSAIDLGLTATLGSVTGQIGDRVPSDPGSEVAVRLEVAGVPGCRATLLGPGSVRFGSAAADESGAIALDRGVPGGTPFVRAEVRRGTAMVALTNPIFLTPAGSPAASPRRSS
ncbi:CehA/McbA family metallohydrolase [Nocardioides hungaricus]